MMKERAPRRIIVKVGRGIIKALVQDHYGGSGIYDMFSAMGIYQAEKVVNKDSLRGFCEREGWVASPEGDSKPLVLENGILVRKILLRRCSDDKPAGIALRRQDEEHFTVVLGKDPYVLEIFSEVE